MPLLRLATLLIGIPLVKCVQYDFIALYGLTNKYVNLNVVKENPMLKMLRTTACDEEKVRLVNICKPVLSMKLKHDFRCRTFAYLSSKKYEVHVKYLFYAFIFGRNS